MTFKRLFVSLFAALALLASIVCVMFFGAPKTTASAAADDASSLDKKTFVLKHAGSDGFYHITSDKWYKFKMDSTPGSLALFSGDTTVGTWGYGDSHYIADSNGNKLGTWVASSESNSIIYFKITGENYKLNVVEFDNYKDYFYEEAENPNESDKDSDSESSERFVDAASKWLKDNLAVNVSAGVVGGIIVIGVLVLIFKRK